MTKMILRLTLCVSTWHYITTLQFFNHVWLMPATRTQETCTRHLHKLSDTGVSVNLVQVFFWYKFLAQNRTQIYSSTETVQHVTRTVQRDWLESCFGEETVLSLREIFHARFWCKFPLQVSWACVNGIRTTSECSCFAHTQTRLTSFIHWSTSIIYISCYHHLIHVNLLFIVSYNIIHIAWAVPSLWSLQFLLRPR